MMGAFGTSAERFINRVGTQATYIRESTGTYDPVAGKYTGGEVHRYEIRVSVSDYKTEFRDGSLVETQNLEVKIPASALPFEPDIAENGFSHRIEIKGRTYDLVSVAPAYAFDQVVLYKVQVEL